MKIKLLDACNITTGKLDSNAAVECGTYPFFTCAPEPLRIDNYNFDDDVILLAGNNASGNFHCQRFKGKFNAYQRTYIITAKPGYDIDYIYYNLLINLSHLKKKAQGSQTKFLTMTLLNEFMIDDLPYDMQKKTGSSLCNLDAQIALNNKIISELESMAKTLYDYWFLQFDFPDENGKPYKSSGGKMIYNKELKRDIPVGWDVKELGDICSFSNGINYDKDVIGDKKYRIVNVRNVSSSTFLINKDNLDIIDLVSKQADKYIVANDSILIARSGCPGAVRLLLDNKDVIYCGFIIQCLPNNATLRYYIAYNLKQYEGSNVTKTGGSILQNVSQDTLKQILLLQPSSYIIDKFNSIICPIIDSLQLKIKENSDLASLRDFLLPMLMNGQVTFKDFK